MSIKKIDVVRVYLGDKFVGAVAQDTSGYYAFEYDPKFVATGIELAPLQMPLSMAGSPFIFNSLPEDTYKRLPAMLADSLPDDFGNNIINAWMAKNGVSVTDITPLDRLAYIDRRGMGALEFRPPLGTRKSSKTAIKLASLVESARKAISGSIETDEFSEAALAQLLQVGTSAGGARAKAIIAWNRGTGEIRAGQFDVPEGFEHWMLKLDVGKDRDLGESTNFGRIEYAYSLMARAAGIHMADCHLLEENGRAHFMTKRFDREGNAKVHMQSLCAMAHLDYKQVATHDYAQLFMTMDRLGLGESAREQAFRRMVFNVLGVNCDDHTKNVSFLMREGGRWELAPAYDITHSYKPGNKWVSQHLMAVNGRFSQARMVDFMVVAERFQIGRAEAMIREVEAAIAAWREFADQAGLPAAETSSIGEDLTNRPV